MQRVIHSEVKGNEGLFCNNYVTVIYRHNLIRCLQCTSLTRSSFMYLALLCAVVEIRDDHITSQYQNSHGTGSVCLVLASFFWSSGLRTDNNYSTLSLSVSCPVTAHMIATDKQCIPMKQQVLHLCTCRCYVQ